MTNQDDVTKTKLPITLEFFRTDKTENIKDKSRKNSNKLIIQL